MKHAIDIHETAFVTCSFRADHPEISGDIYAYLWLNDRIRAIKKAYLKEVSSEESISHAMRNSYFLNTIKKLYEENKIEVVINFGCGFSMYPYLLPSGLQHIEIDKHKVIEYKNAKTKEWINTGKLPKRKLNSLSIDFDDDYVESLKERFNVLSRNKKSFILIEGVLFFLDLNQANMLFRVFNWLQRKAGYIGSASYEPEIRHTEAFKKLLQFASHHVNPTEPNNYLYLPTGFYRDQRSYRLIDHQDFFSSAKKHNYTPNLKPEHILNEHYYILKKE